MLGILHTLYTVENMARTGNLPKFAESFILKECELCSKGQQLSMSDIDQIFIIYDKFCK